VEHAGVAAVPLTKHGATVVAVGYTLAPKANMTRIVEECRESAVFLRKRFPDKRIFVGGHSAGAHLAATLMITDWKQNGMETFPFSGAVLLGGLYDLTPLKKMFCDDDLHFTPEEISQFSPLLQADRLAKLPSGFRCLVARGEEESSGFEKQSQEFIQTLLEHGVDYTSGVIKGSDHFEYTDKLHEEEYILTGMIIKFMSPKN
jgi:arylformamidase